MSELPRHDDTPWALPTREPERETMPNLAKALGGLAKALSGPALQEGKSSRGFSFEERQALALEQIAKTLELVRLELSLFNMAKDRVIR